MEFHNTLLYTLSKKGPVVLAVFHDRFLDLFNEFHINQSTIQSKLVENFMPHENVANKKGSCNLAVLIVQRNWHLNLKPCQAHEASI